MRLREGEVAGDGVGGDQAAVGDRPRVWGMPPELDDGVQVDGDGALQGEGVSLAHVPGHGLVDVRPRDVGGLLPYHEINDVAVVASFKLS